MKIIILDACYEKDSEGLIAIEFSDPVAAYAFYDSACRDMQHEYIIALTDRDGRCYVFTNDPVDRIAYRIALESGRIETVSGVKLLAGTEVDN